MSDVPPYAAKSRANYLRCASTVVLRLSKEELNEVMLETLNVTIFGISYLNAFSLKPKNKRMTNG